MKIVQLKKKSIKIQMKEKAKTKNNKLSKCLIFASNVKTNFHFENKKNFPNFWDNVQKKDTNKSLILLYVL